MTDEFSGVRIEPEYGIRTEIMNSYALPRYFYEKMPKLSAAGRASTLGLMIWYGCRQGRMGRSRRALMDVDVLVEKWKKVIVGLAVAHDKDEADRYEAAIEELLTPILAAPIRQVREFYPKLMKALKEDKRVPFLVWRAYEVWVEQVIAKAPDEDIKELKTDLAREISNMVEQDVKDQIPEALIRALQWRSASTLEEVKQVVAKEKEAGRKTRLVGRESCLFLTAGGTDANPEVCVQI